MWDKLKKLFTRPRLILLGKVAVTIVGLLASAAFTRNESILGYLWAPGLLFGLVVLTWCSTSLLSFFNWRRFAFLAAATGINTAISLIWLYAVGAVLVGTFVYHQETLTSFLLLFLGGGLLGSILMPIAHALLLGSPRKRVFILIPCLFGVFVVAYITFGNLVDISDYSLQAIIITWQAAYLVSMFGFRKKEQLEEVQTEVVE